MPKSISRVEIRLANALQDASALKLDCFRTFIIGKNLEAVQLTVERHISRSYSIALEWR